MLQLQKLFAKLQMKFTNVVDTKDLTKSFQWNAGESFEQQDIQVGYIHMQNNYDFFIFFRNFAEFFLTLLNNHAKIPKPKTLSVSYMKVLIHKNC